MKTRQVARLVAWSLLGAMAIFTLSPIELRPHTPVPADLERIGAFALVGAAFAIAYPKHRLAVLILVLAFAAGLELAQHLTPGRHGRVHDVLVKAFGAALGTLAVILGERALAMQSRRSANGSTGSTLAPLEPPDFSDQGQRLSGADNPNCRRAPIPIRHHERRRERDGTWQRSPKSTSLSLTSPLCCSASTELATA